ncbi:MAG: NAD(P)/FAD-dependent oxidoreductase, partial [Oscillospiraceae bacterium]
MENITRSSIWHGSFGQYPMLKAAISTDVLVIGGGISGILAARLLTDSGVPCVIAETGRICGGITKNTTAKITVHHGLIYSKIIEKYGTEYAKMYLSANQKAAERFEQLAKNIDCDYEKRGSFIYSKTNREPLYNELSALSKIGCHAEFCESVPLPFQTAGAVCVKNQAQFNPLKLLAALTKGLNIYENTHIIEIDKNTAISVDGKITAKKIVFATHFPFVNRHGSYFLKMYQSRSHVLALENAAPVNGIFMDEDANGFSFRDYKNLLLIGGGAHKTGCPSRVQELLAFAERYYPAANPVNLWSAQDCMTLDGLPYVGNYSANTPDWYVMTGFNKWGMTNAMAAAEIIRDKILGSE